MLKMEIRGYLKFVPIHREPSRTLQIWQVMNRRHNDVLGTIAWNNAWHCYCFEGANPEAVFSSGCLDDISKFMFRLTEEAK